MEICAQSLYALVQEEHTEAPIPTTAQSKSAGTWMVCDDVTVCASSWEALSQSRRANPCETVHMLCYRKIGPGVGLEKNGGADEYKDLVEAVKKDGEQRALEREERRKQKEERAAAKKFTETRISQRLREKDSEQLPKADTERMESDRVQPLQVGNLVIVRPEDIEIMDLFELVFFLVCFLFFSRSVCYYNSVYAMIL